MKIQEVLKRHIQTQQAMVDTFERLGMKPEAENVRGVVEGLRLAIEVANTREENGIKD